VALTIALLFAIELTSGQFEADLKFGAILAVLAGAAILAGGILNDRPDLAARLNEATAGIGSGGPAPGGPPPGGYGTGTPSAGAPGAGAAPPAATPAAPPAATPPAAAPPSPTPAAEPATAAQPTQAESGGPAAGWYPDPQGQKRLRYWDGSRWTEQTAD
jgi:hypothetical protein